MKCQKTKQCAADSKCRGIVLKDCAVCAQHYQRAGALLFDFFLIERNPTITHLITRAMVHINPLPQRGASTYPSTKDGLIVTFDCSVA